MKRSTLPLDSGAWGPEPSMKDQTTLKIESLA
jgi:hypothetical protein